MAKGIMVPTELCLSGVALSPHFQPRWLGWLLEEPDDRVCFLAFSHQEPHVVHLGYLQE